MAEKKLPINAVVTLIQGTAAASNAIETAKANDGKVDFKDIGLFLAAFPQVALIADVYKDIIPQFEDIDSQEIDQVLAELAKVGFIGEKADLLKKIRVTLLAARAIYDAVLVFQGKAA